MSDLQERLLIILQRNKAILHSSRTLAERVGYRAPSVVAALRALEGRGLVERVAQEGLMTKSKWRAA